MSNNHQLRLVSLNVQSFGGIDKEKNAEINYPEGFKPTLEKIDPGVGIVLFFPENTRYIQPEGDQGVGKTSLLNALLDITGNEISGDAINSHDKEKKVNLRFYGKDGNLYNARATTKTFILERIETDDNGNPVLNSKGKEQVSVMKTPKDMLYRMAGPAGVDPVTLRKKKPAEQVTWIKDILNLTDEAAATETKIISDYSSNYKSRTTAGNQYDRYKNLTEGSPYWSTFSESEEYFAKTNFDKLEEEFESTRTRYEELTAQENKLSSIREHKLSAAERQVETTKAGIAELERRIAELQANLLKGQQKLVTDIEAVELINKEILEVETWCEEHSSIREEYQNMSSRIQEATEFNSKKKDWAILLENKKLMDYYADEWTRLDGRLKEIAKLKSAMVKSFTPDVPGLEVCVPDEDDKREGLYYNGKPLTALAESELWEMATQLWQRLGVNMVYVEHINELGSGAIEKFNEFIESGGYVFGTAMNRSEKNLKITFSGKIA